jgi:pimeloyl-ACP methyl ester carboxylesterase
VHSPTLTGLGERVHLATPEVGLDTHVQDVHNVLEYEDLSGVVLVGHSYGGLVISGVAAHAAGRLAHLVFLDADVRVDGQAFVDGLPPARRAALEARVRTQGGGWRLPLDVETMLDGYGGWTTQRSAAGWRRGWSRTRGRRPPTRCGSRPAGAGRCRARSSTARATPDRTAAPTGQSARPAGGTGPGCCSGARATGHDAMVTAPRALAELLLEVAGAGR